MDNGTKFSLRRRRIRAVITGLAFFFPGFIFSLPVTCTWASHYYAGEAQAPLGAIGPSFIVGIFSAIVCTIYLLRRANQVKLSKRTIDVLTVLRYRPDSEWAVNILPFGSIYWKDEMPAPADLLNEQDLMTVMKMFGIRLSLWDGGMLDAHERQLWDSVKQQVPDWALFKRLSLSKEQNAARQQAERQVKQEFESLASESDDSPGSRRPARNEMEREK